MKVLYKIILLLLFIFLIIQILLSPNIIMPEIYNTLLLWSNKIIPSLLPFFLLTNFLMSYGLTTILGEFCKPIMKFFKTNSNNAFIVIISIFSGSPSNAFFAKEAINNKLINEDDATKVLLFSHFTSPLFILGTIYSCLNNKSICLLILFVTYFSNLIIAFIFKNFYVSNNINNISIKNIQKIFHNKISFGKTLSNSIHKTFDTLLIILGSMCFFNIILIILKNTFLLNDITYSLISGLFEITQGINNVCLLNISLKIKAVLIAIFLSFGGLSIHSQTLSIISDTKIKYLPYLFARILHSIISGLLVFALFNFIKY